MSAVARLPFLPACLVLVLVLGTAGWWQGRPVALPDAPGGTLPCLSYTAYEPGRLGTRTPGPVSAARIAGDLRALAPYTRCLRLYTPLGPAPAIVEAAAARGFTVLLGAWISRDVVQNRREIDAALELARAWPGTVTLIVVGNEVLLRRELLPAELADLIRAVKAESPVPVAYADVAGFIERNPVVGDAADELLIHLLPYWDDPAPPRVEDATAQVLRQYGEFRARFPGKPVRIGETGWPSAGRARGPGRPGLVNEARFVRSVAAGAAGRGIDWNLIEAIDQPWKQPAEGTVGGYWGLLDEDREPKFPLTGPVSGVPDWPVRTALTVLTGVLLLALALGRGLTARGWVAWTAVCGVTAAALAAQVEFLTLAHAWAELVAGVGGGVLTVLAAALLLRLAGGRPSVVPAPLIELTRTWRRPMAAFASPSLRHALAIAVLLGAAAWLSLALAVAPRHRDIPTAFLLVPALALAAWLRHPPAGARREEAVLAAVIAAGGILQVEFSNPDTWGWLVVSLLLAWPWRGALRAEARRWRHPFKARQPDEGDEHA